MPWHDGLDCSCTCKPHRYPVQPKLPKVAGSSWRLPLLRDTHRLSLRSVLLSVLMYPEAIFPPGADPRMRQAAEQRQVFLTSRSRPLTPQDLSSFDYLIGMDAKNVADIQVRFTSRDRDSSRFGNVRSVVLLQVARQLGLPSDRCRAAPCRYSIVRLRAQVAADHWAAKHEVPSDYRDKVSCGDRMTTSHGAFRTEGLACRQCQFWPSVQLNLRCMCCSRRSDRKAMKQMQNERLLASSDSDTWLLMAD